MPGRREPDTEPSGVICRRVWNAVGLVAVFRYLFLFFSSEWYVTYIDSALA